MNAISGIVSQHLDKSAENLIKKMCDLQLHRSTKEKKICFNRNICFGVKLKKGSMQLARKINQNISESNSFYFVGDCSIYNKSELKKDLEHRGFEIETTDDSEFFIKMFMCFGTKCVEYFRGDFSFAIWNVKLKKLFLFRDRFGVKPLFYYHHPNEGKLIFASELKALSKNDLLKKDLDFQAIYHYLFLTFFPQPYTPFKYIKSLMPGSYLTYDIMKNSVTIREYWDIPCIDDKPGCHEKDIIGNCGQILEESVKIRCPGDTITTGISLSSGMDSSAIAALVNKFHPKLKTFTFGFGKDHQHLNEFSLSRKVADRLNSNHHEIRLSGVEIIDNLFELVSFLNTPIVGMFLPYFFAKEAKNQSVEVAFRGDGGNSAFQNQADQKIIILEYILSFLGVLPDSIVIKIYEKLEYFLSHFLKNDYIKNKKISGLCHLIHSYSAFRSGTINIDLMFDRFERKKLISSNSWRLENDFKETNFIGLNYFAGNACTIQERFNYGDFKVYNDQGVAHLHTIAANFGVDLKLPYFDHKLVEYIQSFIPLYLKDKNGVDKYILKKITKDILPKEILHRKARGFYAPFHDWLKGELRPVVDDVFSINTVKKRNIFNHRVIREIYQKYYDTDKPYSTSWRKILVFVMLEVWLRKQLD